MHLLIYITASYVLGIWSQSCSSFSFFSSILVALIGVVILCATTHNNLSRLALTILACILAYATGAQRLCQQQIEHQAFYSTTKDKSLDIIVRITDIATVDHPTFNQRVTMTLLKIKNHEDESDRWVSSNKRIQLYTYTKHKIQVDDTISLSDITFKQPTNSSFENYLIKEGIAATLFMPKCKHTLIKRPSRSLRRWLYSMKKNLLDTLKSKMSPHAQHLFGSVFLGNKEMPKKETERTRQQFTMWGITHYLARSGLHLVIFVLCWHLILGLFPLHFSHKQTFLVFLCTIYFILSWSSISFIRAFATFILYKLCILLRVQADFLHLLTLVCFFVLLTNPTQLFFLDFQLSFGLTLALAYFNRLQKQQQLSRCKTVAS